MRALISVILCATSVSGQAPKRPRITGVAHVALYVQDIEKSREFYKDFLGFGEPFLLNQADGKLALTFIKVNDRQYIELFPEVQPGSDRLHHISIEVEDAEAMRAYLGAHGIKVPEKVGKGRIGNSNFNVKDPDGHTVEIVEYEPDGWSVREKGKHMSDDRISQRILHLGIVVGALEPALKFYRDLLGFEDIWRGSRDGKLLNWVNMRVPDGGDYIEFMLYKELAPPNKRGVEHHIALEVPDMDRAVAQLGSRPARSRYTRPIEVRTGINRRRQLNLFDPDGTRVELMEPKTVDGVPPLSSTAPPPH